MFFSVYTIWRMCFEWKENNALNVEIVDYH